MELEVLTSVSSPPATPPFQAVDQCIARDRFLPSKQFNLSFALALHVFCATGVLGVATLFSLNFSMFANRRNFR